MAFVESWVETDPDGSVITGSLLDDFQRQGKRAMRERLEGDPSNPNSGIFEVGTFGATAIVRAGTARAYAVTAAGVGALTLQDGRIALTTDTNRLFHLKGAGAVEIGYIPLSGTAGNVTFGLVTSTLGFVVSGNGTYAAGKVYKDATNGLLFSGVAGSTNDATITNGAGAVALRVPTGTQNLVSPGNMSATYFQISASAGGFVQAKLYRDPTHGLVLSAATGVTNDLIMTDAAGNIAARIPTGTQDLRVAGSLITSVGMTAPVFIVSGGSPALTGVIRLGTATGLNWRNAANSGDIAILYTTGTTTVLGSEAQTSFDVGGATQAAVSTAGITAVAFTSSDDQSKKITIGRYSPGIPSAYLKIAAAATNGLRITNASGAADIMILDNAGTVNFTGNGQFDGRLDVAGSAVAVAAGYLSIGGNTSTTANTYGGGGVSALPAQPRGYLPIYLGATNFKVPYYVA